LTEYRAIIEIFAEQWTGENLEAMKELLQDVVDFDDEGPFVYVDEVEPFYYASQVTGEVLIDRPAYNMLKF
jgi:hypothetical protein